MEATFDILSEIVGTEFVSDDPELLASYAADHSPVPRRSPRWIVRPQNAAEVRELVLWANRTRTPLVPVSSGAPHFHGDTVPSQPESVIVDLARMNRILRLDRRNKIVVIEPGVTYAQLDVALAAVGLRIAKPLKPRANKSVVASLLDRQPTTIPRLNFSLPEPLRTCGVVWGTGEISFTGEAGNGPLDLDEQWKRGAAQIDPKGPNATDLMRLLTGAQGTMGVAVWASVKCELAPEAQRFLFAPAETLDDLVEFCYKAERIRIGDDVFVMNAAQLATLVGNDPAGIAKLRVKLPKWVAIFRLAGAGYYPAERVEVQDLDLRRVAQQAGVDLSNALPGIDSAALQMLFANIEPDSHHKFALHGASEELFFLTTLDKTPGFVADVMALANQRSYPAAEIGIYLQPQHQGVAQHLEFAFPFNPEDPAETERVRLLVEEAGSQAMAGGAYFSRIYGLWAAKVYNHDAASRRILLAVKQIVDPNCVLNPGKLCF